MSKIHASNPKQVARASTSGRRDLDSGGVKGSIRSRWFIVLLMLVFLVGTAVFFSHDAGLQKENASSYQTLITATRRKHTQRLRELGHVVAKHETLVLSQFSGEVVWKIEEGTFVAAGTVVVRFSAIQVADQLEKLEESLFDKEEIVTQTQKALETIQRRYTLQVAKQQVGVDVSALDRSMVYAQPLEDDIKRGKLDLESALLKLEKAKRIYETNGTLFKKGFVTEAVVKQKRLAFARENANYSKQRIIHDLLLQGATSDAKRLADLRHEEAKNLLATAKFNRDADLATERANLELAMIELDNLKLEIDRKKRYLESANLKAPVQGRVAFVDVWKGSRQSLSPIQIGESRRRGQVVCRIANTSTLRIRVLVNDVDLRKLKIGMSADIVLLAYPKKKYQGKVSEIALVSQDKNAALDRLAMNRSGEAFVNVTEVFLDFVGLSRSARENVRLGFSAEALILYVDGRESTMLPWAAVGEGKEGGHFVKVPRTGGGFLSREVKIGSSNERFVEILEGLKPEALVRAHFDERTE